MLNLFSVRNLQSVCKQIITYGEKPNEACAYVTVRMRSLLPVVVPLYIIKTTPGSHRHGAAECVYYSYHTCRLVAKGVTQF